MTCVDLVFVGDKLEPTGMELLTEPDLVPLAPKVQELLKQIAHPLHLEDMIRQLTPTQLLLRKVRLALHSYM
jgi:hypothetical protein